MRFAPNKILTLLVQCLPVTPFSTVSTLFLIISVICRNGCQSDVTTGILLLLSSPGIKAPLAKDKHSESAVKLWQLTFPTKARQNITTNPTNINELLCELGSYKDLMAKVLLQAWDSEGLTTPPEPRKYVESWLLDTVSNTSQCKFFYAMQTESLQLKV